MRDSPCPPFFISYTFWLFTVNLFQENMERKIGEIFEVDGQWYQCVQGNCEVCDFSRDEHICLLGVSNCVKFRRNNDCKSVAFKKLEKVGEPYTTFVDKTVQNYLLETAVTIPPKNVFTLINNEQRLIAIEIKQTKEDMEESVEEKLFCNKVAKANAEYMKAKLNSSLKPFDIKAAKAGKSVYTRDGRKVRIICFDANGSRPIVALVTECDGEEIPYKYHCDGSYNCQSIPSDNDLMMLSEKKEGWVNIYDDMKMYASEERAKIGISTERNYITTAKVEWEE